jgi:hypothetical protein
MEQKKKWEFKPNDEYPNTGTLSVSKFKSNEKSPEFYGAIGIERSYLQHLIDSTDDMQAVIKLSAWKRPSGDGGSFLSLQVDTYTGGGAAKAAPAKQEESDPWA